MVRRLVVASVAHLPVVSVVRLRVVLEWVVRPWVVRLRAVSADLRLIKVLVVVVFNNNRWEWEELQCKVVREWVRVWRRVECSRTAVRQAVVR